MYCIAASHGSNSSDSWGFPCYQIVGFHFLCSLNSCSSVSVSLCTDFQHLKARWRWLLWRRQKMDPLPWEATAQYIVERFPIDRVLGQSSLACTSSLVGNLNIPRKCLHIHFFALIKDAEKGQGPKQQMYHWATAQKWQTPWYALWTDTTTGP